jgi:micrococcal nuclease
MYEYEALVTNVVDGDTYDMKISLGFNVWINMRFRLMGVDTPETWRPKNEAEREHGELATQMVKDLIENKMVNIKSYRPDKYGRYLCDVIIDGINLADYIIANGLVKLDLY